MEQFWTNTQKTFEGMTEQVITFLPSLLGGVLILLVGLVVATLLSRATRALLLRTDIDNRLANAVASGSHIAKATEEVAARFVFWMVMVVVLVAFFATLQLTVVTEPLNALLGSVLTFIPMLAAAFVLGLFAWVLAKLARRGIREALEAARVDQRLASDDEGDTPASEPRLSHAASELGYWLIIVLFLPAILGVLGLEGLLVPVRQLAEDVLGYVPNLLGAAAILIAGWLAARVLRRVVVQLLRSAGVDRLSARLGMQGGAEERRLSDLLGLLLFALVLLPVVVAALEALQIAALTAPASEVLGRFLAALPRFVAVFVLLALTLGVGRLLARLVEDVLSGLGFDRLPARLGLLKEGAEPTRRPSQIAGALVLIALLLLASIEAAGLFEFDALRGILMAFTVFASQVLFAVVIFGFALWLGALAARLVSDSGVKNARFLSLLARAAVVLFGGTIALREMGLGDEIITLAFGLSLGGLAVAFALAVGLGARETAGKEVARFIERWRAGEVGGDDVTR